MFMNLLIPDVRILNLEVVYLKKEKGKILWKGKFEVQRKAAMKELKKLYGKYGPALESAARRFLASSQQRRKLEKDIQTARKGLKELEAKRRC